MGKRLGWFVHGLRRPRSLKAIMLLFVEIPIPSPDNIIDHAAGKSEVLFLVTVVLVLYAISSFVRFRYIDHPESKQRIEKQQKDIENGVKTTVAIQTMAQTTERQQNLLESQAKDIHHIKSRVEHISQICRGGDSRQNGGQA